MTYLNNGLLISLVLMPSAVLASEPQVSAPGVPNFHQVNDHIYRGAQPNDQGWESLAKLGVKVVIDLRRENEEGNHSVAAEAKAVQAAGMKYVNIPMNGIVAPRDVDVAKVMQLFNGTEPVFVHCKLGKDRTGTVVACYRIAHDQWKNENALAEAKGIGLHWVEMGMKRYIASFRNVPAPEPAPGAMASVAAANQ